MTPEQLAEIRARSAYDVRFVLPDASSQARLKDAIHDRAALLDYIEELEGALKKIERAMKDYIHEEDGANVALKIARAALSEPTNA